ncbi:MAG TPA: hypothetical protein PLN64_00925 [Candidatus Bipolaricaulis anaerobius]|nr:hypothetical protein [Candidatus Bipolaricaulis anaerobius]
MAGASTYLRYSIFVDKHDVTPWVTAIEIEQPRRTIYRKAEITLAGLSPDALPAGGRWDVFGTYDAAEPYQVELIRNGYLPPDREGAVLVTGGTVPKMTLTVYDYVWVLQRRAPEETIVCVPGNGIVWDHTPDQVYYVVENQIQTALDNLHGITRDPYKPTPYFPAGRYRVLNFIRTAAQAARQLGLMAGVHVDWQLPDYKLKPYAIGSGTTYWDAILALAAPYAPEIFYQRAWNTLQLVDPLTRKWGGETMNLPAGLVTSVRGAPQTRRTIRRVVVRVP